MQSLPAISDTEIRCLISDLIVPGMADIQVKALVTLLRATADLEDVEKSRMAHEAARSAFEQTDECEKAFERFTDSGLNESDAIESQTVA